MDSEHHVQQPGRERARPQKHLPAWKRAVLAVVAPLLALLLKGVWALFRFEVEGDESFRELMLRDLDAALAAASVQLSNSERATIESIPPDQLQATIDRFAQIDPLPSGAPSPPRPNAGPPYPVPAGIRPK